MNKTKFYNIKSIEKKRYIMSLLHICEENKLSKEVIFLLNSGYVFSDSILNNLYNVLELSINIITNMEYSKKVNYISSLREESDCDNKKSSFEADMILSKIL